MLSVCETLFKELYRVDEPIVALDRLVHWTDLLRRLDIPPTALDRASTSIFGGYFYNTSTPAPTLEDIRSQVDRGRDAGVSQFLVPTVRNSADGSALADEGFVSIPWFVEASYGLRDGVERDLRAQLGNRRQKRLLRLWEAANLQYPPRFYGAADIHDAPAILDVAASLHDHNVRKYRHGLNFYSTNVLQALAKSPLAENLVICIRYDKDTGCPVQVSISLVDLESAQMYGLVQGIHRSLVEPGQNLYIADTCELFRYAEDHGLAEVNLGRGATVEKLRLGANQFHLLNTWVKSPSSEAATKLALIRARAIEALGLGRERLHPTS